jgi:hypothetical protein
MMKSVLYLMDLLALLALPCVLSVRWSRSVLFLCGFSDPKDSNLIIAPQTAHSLGAAGVARIWATTISAALAASPTDDW